jgi:hypothetical protein
MRLLSEPLSQDFEAQKQNDIWTLRQILSAIAQTIYNEKEHRVLNKVLYFATTEVLLCILLGDITSILLSASALTRSELSLVNAIRVKATVRAVA